MSPLLLLILSMAAPPTGSAPKPMPAQPTESAPATSNATLSTLSNVSSRKKMDSRVEMRRFENLEKGLARSRAAIKRAVLGRNYTSRNCQSFVPTGQIYRNSYAFHFHQSHIETEKRLKIRIYMEQEPPIFHDGSSMGLYSIESHFIQEMDRQRLPFITNDPEQVMLYFLPFNVQRMRRFVTPKGVVDLYHMWVLISDY
ncbi:unnamed protein product [Victoria cruziana]